MDWIYKLIFILVVVLLIFTIPLSFASPHFMHEEPEGPFYKTMGFYTHVKEVPTICIMQSEYRDLTFEYSVIASSLILNYNLPQHLNTSTKVIPFSQHEDLMPKDYPECFVFVVKKTGVDGENFATTQFFNDYRLITVYNLTINYTDMLYINTHEIIHAVYGIEHLYCGPYLNCEGIMQPNYKSGDNYNITDSDINAILEVTEIINDHNIEFKPHWIYYKFS